MNEERRVSKGGIRTNIDGTAVTGINGSTTGSFKGSGSQGSHHRSSTGNRVKNNLTINDHQSDYLSSNSRPDFRHAGLDYALSSTQSRNRSSSSRHSGESFHANDISAVNLQASHTKGHQSLTLEGQQQSKGPQKSGQSLASSKNNAQPVGWERTAEEVSSNVSSEEEEEEEDAEAEGEATGDESDQLVIAHSSPVREPVPRVQGYTSTSNNSSSDEDDEIAAAAEEKRKQQIAELKVKQKELRKKVRQLKYHQESGSSAASSSTSLGGKTNVPKSNAGNPWVHKESPFALENKKSQPHPAHHPYPRSPSPSPYDGQGSTGADSPLDLCVKKTDTPAASAAKVQQELSITLVSPAMVTTSTPLPARSPDRITLSVIPTSSKTSQSPSPIPASTRRKTGHRKLVSSMHTAPSQLISPGSHPNLSMNTSAPSAIHNHTSLASDLPLLANRTGTTASPSISQMSDSESSLSLSQNSSCAVAPPISELNSRREKKKKLEKRKGAENSHHAMDGKGAKRQNLSNSSSDSESSGDSGSDTSGDTERSAAASTASSSTAQTSSPLGLKRHHSQKSLGSSRKRRRTIPEERELRIPLEHGWRRQTKIRCFSRSGVRGEVIYYGPCGKKLRNYPEVIRYIQRNGITDLTRDNFCFSTKVNIGDFLERPPGGMPEDCVQISEQEVIARIEEVRRRKGRLGALHTRIDSRKRITPEESEKQRKWEEIQMQRRLQQQVSEGSKDVPRHAIQKLLGAPLREIARQALQLKALRQLEQEHNNHQARELKRFRAEEARRQKEQQKHSKQQEKAEKLEQLRQEKERQAQQALEEREAKHQQALLREQELQKRREMLMLVDLERERRRQHMMLVRALETRKKQEERDRKREEFLQEREIHRQKKLEQRRIEMQLIREIKKPVDDMMLKETTALPTLNRIPGLKVCGRAFSNLLMVFEFLHNFGESLGFDMDNLPSLNTLQLAILNHNEKYEEELLSVLHHLLVCAIDDPGIPSPRQNLTVLGHTLRETDITNNNVSEVLRLYVTAMDRNSEICRWLTERPFLSLNPTQKSAVLAFICNELLCSRIIVRQIDNSIDAVNSLKKEKWIVEGQLRRLRAVQVRRTQNSKPKEGKEDESKGAEGEGGTSSAKKKKDKSAHDLDDDDDIGNESGNESDETQETGQLSDGEDEEPELSNEELEKKIEKLARQATQFQNKLIKASHTLRGSSLGQDRYRRRYWVLPKAGGVFCEGLESSEAFCTETFPVESPEEAAKKAVEEAAKAAEAAKNPKPQKGEDSKVVKTDSSPVKVKEKEKKKEDAGETKEEVKGTTEKVEKKEPEGEVTNQNPKEEKVAIKKEVVKTEKEVLVTKDESSSPVKKSESAEIVSTAKELSSPAQVKSLIPSLMDGKVVNASSAPLLGLSQTGVPSLPAHLGGDKNNWLLHSPIFASILASSMFFNGPMMPPSREINGSFLGNKNEHVSQFNPFMNDFLSPDQFLKAMSDPQAVQQQQHKNWFSILPRYPCDKQSLVVSPPPLQDSKTPPKVSLEGASIKSSLSDSQVDSGSLTTSALTNIQLGLLNGVPPGTLMNSLLSPQSSGQHGDLSVEKKAGTSGDLAAESPLLLGGTLVPPSMLNHPKRAMLQRMQHDTPLPIALDLQRGYWRITDAGQLRTMLESLHHRGIREKMLQKYVQKHLTHLCAVCIAGQSLTPDTELEITDIDRYISKLPGGAPEPDDPEDWLSDVALRLDLSTLEQVEALEEKVAGASMQIKVSLPLQGWKQPPKLSCDTTVHFKPACTFRSSLPGADALRAQLKDANDNKRKSDKLSVNGETADASLLPEGNEEEAEGKKEGKAGDDGVTVSVEDTSSHDEMDVEVKEGEVVNPIELAKRRLLRVEAAIERRYLRPPLGTSTELNLATMTNPSGTPGQSSTPNHRESGSRDSGSSTPHQTPVESSSLAMEVTPGLLKWRRSVQNCFSSAQLTMCINALENCIAWDKSIMRASCQFCHNGDNEEMLLLCDGCDKGYHTYCFKPKMDTIPDGDWYCYECLNKATGDKVCVMCGKKGKLLECADCPKTFHMNCIEPPVTKYPKGKWHCPGCGHKAPKKSSSKSKSSGNSSHKEKEHKETKEKPEKAEKETPKRSSNNNNTSTNESPAASTTPAEKSKPKEPRKVKEKGNKDLTPCRAIMDELESSEDAWPFLLPVNTKQFPTYRKVIKKPMDLSTIRNKLENGGYKCREDYVSDVRTIFDNCETFNEDDSPVGIAGHNLRGFFECRWIELTSS